MFSPDKFGELPVQYVYEAVKHGQDLRRRELHEAELPVANLTALTANLNRDVKKNRTPYKVTEFCFYADREDRNDPDAINAAAYMALLKDGKIPAWALYIYPDMKSNAGDTAPPDDLAAIGQDFLLIAPQPVNGGMEGLLLAKQRVAGELILVKVGNTSVRVRVPEFEESVVAREYVFVGVH